ILCYRFSLLDFPAAHFFSGSLPAEPFMTEFLTGPRKNLTVEHEKNRAVT
uniref:Uncharacterized protein n=1 Tax=Salarias fasciatus TaxID=181472 RepID=A0A672FUM4_SALFA